MENQNNKVPEGYMRDGQGRLIPVDMVKPIDKARDEIVREIVAKAMTVAGEIAEFKHKALGDIEAFIELSADTHGVKLGGEKGNVSLRTFDGEYRIQRAIDESMSFDEQLQVAKALIDECIHEWSEGSRSEIKVLINDAFQVDKEGRISTSRILSLRRLNISDSKWQRAMKIIGESLQVDGSKTYIRIYKRGKDGKYEHVSLDVAA